MASPLFQDHHIIEQKYKTDWFFQELKRYGGFDIDSQLNRVNLPADLNLARSMGVTPHTGGPLNAYKELLATHIDDFKIAYAEMKAEFGPNLAAKLIGGQIKQMAGGMRLALEKGELYTNTPLGWTPEQASAVTTRTMTSIDSYAEINTQKVDSYLKLSQAELRWSTVLSSSQRTEQVLDALLADGAAKAAKGPALDAFEDLAGAVAIQHRNSVIPAGISSKITKVMSKIVSGAAVLGVAGLILDVTTSTAEAAELTRAGQNAEAAITMSKLAARLAFGWKGAAVGAAWGAAAGPIGAAVGAFVGGVGGAVAGDLTVDAIAGLANSFTTSVSKATGTPGGSTGGGGGGTTSPGGNPGTSPGGGTSGGRGDFYKGGDPKSPRQDFYPGGGTGRRRDGAWVGPIYNEGTGKWSWPVMLDLNRDNHIDLRPFDITEFANGSAPRFDWDGDGVKDGTTWVGPTDGWLAIDLAANGGAGPDGRIDQARELAFTLWKTPQELAAEQNPSDLAAIRQFFDTNRNNQLDPGDARWSEFRVWQDANQNGITDAGELRTLAQADIRLIELVPSTANPQYFSDSSAITGTSSYLRGDGTRSLVGDVVVAKRSGKDLAAL